MLDEDTKELIKQQLQLLSDKSKEESNENALIDYSNAIANLARVLID